MVVPVPFTATQVVRVVSVLVPKCLTLLLVDMMLSVKFVGGCSKLVCWSDLQRNAAYTYGNDMSIVDLILWSACFEWLPVQDMAEGWSFGDPVISFLRI